MSLPQSDILPLIPQRKPFVMIDQLLAVDEISGTSRFRVQPDNIFVADGQLGEAALVENIAQTAAARIGYLCGREGRPVPLGYIGAVQQLGVFRLPKINEELETRITIKNQIFEVTVISGTVSDREGLLAQCDMKIFISTKP